MLMIKAPLIFLAILTLAFFPDPLRAESELIANDKFADEGATWSLKVAPDASASMSVVDEAGEKALCIEVQAPPQDKEMAPDVRVQRLFGEIIAGKNYHVAFKAKAAEPVKIIPYIYPEKEGARVLWRTEINLDADWKEFTYTFEGRDAADNCVLGFSHLGKTANTYWFKDVALTSD